MMIKYIKDHTQRKNTPGPYNYSYCFSTGNHARARNFHGDNILPHRSFKKFFKIYCFRDRTGIEKHVNKHNTTWSHV